LAAKSFRYTRSNMASNHPCILKAWLSIYK
jgi:hypothetical protein